MKRERINIVDKGNVLIGTKFRDEINCKADIYQLPALWLTNLSDEVLVAQRTLTKDKDPGMWGPALTGTVEEGETFETNLYKEAQEELGLVDVKFKTGPLQRNYEPRNSFAQWFYGTVDIEAKDFVLQEEEVEKVVWISKKDLLQDMENNPNKYMKSFVSIIDELINL